MCTLKAMNKMVVLEYGQFRLVQWLVTQPPQVSLGHA